MTKQIGHREFMNLRHKLEKKRTHIKINKEQWVSDLGSDYLISDIDDSYISNDLNYIIKWLNEKKYFNINEDINLTFQTQNQIKIKPKTT